MNIWGAGKLSHTREGGDTLHALLRGLVAAARALPAAGGPDSCASHSRLLAPRLLMLCALSTAASVDSEAEPARVATKAAH